MASWLGGDEMMNRFDRPAIDHINDHPLNSTPPYPTSYKTPYRTADTMRYSLGAATTTALLATSTLSLALPTASSLFNLQDSSLSVPAVAEKVFGSVGSWLGAAEKNVHDTVKGMKVSKLVQDGVDCERTPTICFIPPLTAF
jgi:hypothetical protein